MSHSPKAFVCVALLFLTFAAANATEHWVGSWAASQQAPEENNRLSEATLTDATLRQVVHLSIGGKRVRVLLSNAFGTAPLTIGEVHVALSTAANRSSIASSSDRLVTFGGNNKVIIPAGASYWSDPIDLKVSPLSDIAVSLYFPNAPQGKTSHSGSRATSYLVHGNRVGASDLLDAEKVNRWFQVASIAVDATRAARAIVVLGDSITDGYGTTTDGNDRWTDVFAKRLQSNAKFRSVAVLNHGIGGNRLLRDGTASNALARFDRDVLAQVGVRYLVLLEGVNDLGMLTRDAPVSAEAHASLVSQIIGAYEQIIMRAHAVGIRVYGATILPYGASRYYHPDASNEADRQAINEWIRKKGNFDATIDLDAVLRDPKSPEKLNPLFDSGDGLHPSLAGYRAMAEAVSLKLFN